MKKKKQNKENFRIEKWNKEFEDFQRKRFKMNLEHQLRSIALKGNQEFDRDNGYI